MHKLWMCLAILCAWGFQVHAATASDNHAWIPGSVLIPTPGTIAWEEHLSWDGVDRSAIVIRPEFTSTSPAAAIVALHYEYGNSALMANLTAIGKLASQQGYWVILPQAVNNQWSDDPLKPQETTDDVGFLAQLITTLTQRYPIDPQKVSMTGFSNGGFMTETMICQHPELIASAVVVAAELRIAEQNVCTPNRAVPTIVVMGNADPVVAYSGHQWTLLSAVETFSWWRNINGCNPLVPPLSVDLTPTVDDGTSINVQTSLSGCSGNNEVTLYTVNGGGHAWPGSPVDTNAISFGLLGPRSLNLDATALVGNFARLWTNTAAPVATSATGTQP